MKAWPSAWAVGSPSFIYIMGVLHLGEKWSKSCNWTVKLLPSSGQNVALQSCKQEKNGVTQIRKIHNECEGAQSPSGQAKVTFNHFDYNVSWNSARILCKVKTRVLIRSWCLFHHHSLFTLSIKSTFPCGGFYLHLCSDWRLIAVGMRSLWSTNKMTIRRNHRRWLIAGKQTWICDYLLGFKV